jgi:hypothetical protein
MRKLLLCILFPFIVVAYNDNDLDGVEDKDDLCPNTSLVEIVDNTGCTIEKLIAPTPTTPTKKNSSYDVVLGVGYAKNKNSHTQIETLQLDYFYKKFSFQLQSSHFTLSRDNKNKSAISDTYLGAFYRINVTNALHLNIGARFNLPTYESNLNNNNLDYSISTSFNYRVENFTCTGGVGYTVINDDDINSSSYQLEYQNSLNYHIGVGYFFTARLYSNLSYLHSTSIYKAYDEHNSLSFYGHYNLSSHWFSTLSYSKGLNDETKDYSSLLRLGYYF